MRRFGQGQHAADRPQASVEAELADGRVLVQPLARDLAGGGQDRQSDREVEAGTLFPKLGGREVDRDPLANRPFELGGGDSASHAVLRLLAGAVGEADDRETGDAVVEVRLDLDAAGVEADERMGDGAREHSSQTRLPADT